MKLKGPVSSNKLRIFPDDGSKSIFPWVIELLLEESEQLSEGQVREEAHQEELFFGSTMITCDLDRLSGRIREKITPELACAVADSLSESQEFHSEVMRIGKLDAERRIGARLPRHTEGDVRLRTVGTSILIDVDIECHLLRPKAPAKKEG